MRDRRARRAAGPRLVEVFRVESAGSRPAGAYRGRRRLADAAADVSQAGGAPGRASPRPGIDRCRRAAADGGELIRSAVAVRIAGGGRKGVVVASDYVRATLAARARGA